MQRTSGSFLGFRWQVEPVVKIRLALFIRTGDRKPVFEFGVVAGNRTRDLHLVEQGANHYTIGPEPLFSYT